MKPSSKEIANKRISAMSKEQVEKVLVFMADIETKNTSSKQQANEHHRK